jgi:stage V sporulation protein B
VSEKELARGWLVSLGRHVAIGLLGLIWLALITRALTEDEVGALILVVALPSLLGPLFNLGFPMGLIYLTARGALPVMSLAGWALRTGALLSVGAAFILAAGVAVTLGIGFDGNSLVAWGLISIPLAVFSSMGAAFFQGRRMFSRQAQILVAPIALTALGTAAAVLVAEPSALTLVAVVVASHVVTAAWVLLQLQAEGPEWVETAEIGRQAWNYSWRAYLSEGAAAIRARIDLVLVAAFLGTGSAALFGTATALAGQIALLSLAAHQVVFPFAAATSASSKPEQEDLTPRTARVSFALTLVAGIGLALLSGPVLGLLYGADFSRGWPILVAYLPSVVFLSLSRIITADLSGRGAIDVVLRISVVATVFAGVTVPIGIAVAGATGAAAAASVTALFNTALRVRAHRAISGVPFGSLVIPQRGDLSGLLGAIGIGRTPRAPSGS